VGQFTAVRYRLSAVRFLLPAGHCHSERSEESRCVPLVISMPINTREDIRLTDIRHTLFPKARGFRRLRRPGSIGRALPADRWVQPGNGSAFRAGSEGSYKVHSMEAGWAPPAPFYNAPAGRHHHPLNPLNLMNPLNPHAAGVPMSPLRPPPKSAIILHIYISQLSSVNQL
jgi:hypothetical protein